MFTSQKNFRNINIEIMDYRKRRLETSLNNQLANVSWANTLQRHSLGAIGGTKKVLDVVLLRTSRRQIPDSHAWLGFQHCGPGPAGSLAAEDWGLGFLLCNTVIITPTRRVVGRIKWDNKYTYHLAEYPAGSKQAGNDRYYGLIFLRYTLGYKEASEKEKEWG